MNNIKLKGAKNTRDFGGIVNAEGKTIKPHCFIRSATLNEITKRDSSILFNEYGLRTIIDLRTDEEISESPDAVPDGVKYFHIPVFSDEAVGITHSSETDKKEMLNSLPDLCDLYRTIVTDKGCVEQLRKIFSIITSLEGNAILWHCTEGKDRCGITSALLLSILDVDRDTIYEDYLYTNNAASKNAKKYYRLVRYLMHDRENAERIRRLFSAEREYLDAAFSEIEKQYGSTENFIRNELGISDELKSKMKQKYLI